MEYLKPKGSKQTSISQEEDCNQKYKTEICRNWSIGLCPFADQCFFAHGVEEIRTKKRFGNYKTKDCKQFHQLGYCQYGLRCQFKHRKTSVDTASNSPNPSSNYKQENKQNSQEYFKKRLPVFVRLAPI
jgi:Zinc finger C-x8-C-x5-C-x3-H type (and similar)